MDSSHVTWFNSLFDDFKGAIARRDFVGQARRGSRSCACSSSRRPTPRRARSSRELPLLGLEALQGDDVSDRLARRARATGTRDLKA